MRIAVHSDLEYHVVDDEIYGEHAFTLFLVRLAEEVDQLVVFGRLGTEEGKARYPLGTRIKFVPIPFYANLMSVRDSIPAMLTGLRRFWRALPDLDVVWLLGPHPLHLAFMALAPLRGRAVAIGIRQEFPRYVASRHPGRRDLWLLSVGMELAWRLIARFSRVVVVGPALAQRYRRSRRLLEITASLVSSEDVVKPDEALLRHDADARAALSVGRIEAEKNPLLMADILDGLVARDERWVLRVVGEGPMTPELRGRLRRAGVADHAELLGYLPFGEELLEQYRSSTVLLHVSWTEGLPQVLLEAFAIGLPVVATDVGGIREAVGDAAVLVEPGDADPAVSAAIAVSSDRALRERLVRAGHEYVRTRTLEVEAGRVARFLTRT